MVPFSGILAIAISILGSSPQEEKIVVKNVRPSRVVMALSKFLPTEDVVTADDEAGVVVVKDPGLMKLVAEKIARLDVAPQKVRLTASLVSKIDHTKNELVATIPDGIPFEWTDQQVELKVAVTPRLNADDSLTLEVNTYYRQSYGTVFLRKKVGEELVLRFDRNGQARFDCESKEASQWPVVRLKAVKAN